METLIAPSYWAIEAANAIWSQVARRLLEPAFAVKYLRKLVGGPITAVSPAEDLLPGLEIALRLKHPIYDCIYLALAIRHDTYVVTADSRFVGVCVSDGKWQRHVRLLEGA